MSRSDNYLFHYYDLPHGFTTPSHFLYNSIEHLRLQHAKYWRIFELISQPTHSIKARIALHVEGTKAVSPFRAPFGFIELFEKIAVDDLTGWFSLIETDLRGRGVKMIQLKSYPEVYGKYFNVLEAGLKKLHYSINQEVSSVIQVDRKPFKKKIRISELQKLRKAEKMFSFEKLKITRLREVYTFIDACRKEKNQHLSMSFSDLKKVGITFPRNFYLFRVYDASGTAAAAVVIKVNHEILYTFYYAHTRRFDKVSPVVFLISSVYELAQQQGIKMIDLGTSMIDGKVNRSLLHFKKSIGGESYRKLIFEKILA
jgi:hypothetical protein